jgi:hypothetical protein
MLGIKTHVLEIENIKRKVCFFFQLVFTTTFCTTQILFVTCNSKVATLHKKVVALDKK